MPHTKAGPFVTGVAPALNAGHMNVLDSQYDDAMADVAALFRKQIPSLEGVAFTIFGDSYGKGGAGADDGTRFLDRLALRQRTNTPTNYAVAGYRSDQTLAQVEANWAPNTRGLVGLADIVINDLNQYGDDPSKATTVDVFRAILARLTSWVILTPTSSSLAYGPGWTAGATTTAGSYADVSWTGDSCYVLVGMVTTAGTTIIFADGTGATVATVATGNRRNPFNGVVKLSGFGSGQHSLRATASGAASILGLIIPSPVPPTIMWNKPGAYTFNASTSQPLRVSYLAACAAILPDFPSVIPVDVGSGWNTATMLGPDGLHPNDLGHSYIASQHETALAAVGFRQGLNQLTEPNAGTYTPVTPAYSTPTATVPAAPSSVTAVAGAQATVTWVRGTDGGATITSQVIQASTDGTTWADALTGIAMSASSATITSGLTAGNSYQFRVLAVNALGRGTASATSSAVTAGTAPVVYSADTFTRADGAMGTTETGSQTWTVPGGGSTAWAISSDTAKATAVTEATAPGDLFVDDGQANGTITATLVSVVANAGIAFRIGGTNDANGLLFWAASGQYRISKRTAVNAYTTLASTTGITPAAGDVLAVIMNGSSITAKVNGTQVLTATDSSYTANTKHGIWSGAAGGILDAFQHTNLLS